MPALETDIASICIASPLGVLTARASERGVASIGFPDDSDSPRRQVEEHRHAPIDATASPHLELLRRQLDGYFAGAAAPFTVPLDPRCTPFQLEVWNALRAIPYGQTRSYTQVAQAIGRPGSVRAVANANGNNPIAILIPCHRVIGADGSLTGYAGGLWRKERLLRLERSRLI